MDAILHRVPAVEQAEVRQVLNGPESITPDGLALLGEVPEVSRVNEGSFSVSRHCGVFYAD